MGNEGAVDSCDRVRFPQLYSSPYCQRMAGHGPDHFGFGQHWRDDEASCSLPQCEVFMAARDRVGDWAGASHLAPVEVNGEIMVEVPAQLYNALMGITGDVSAPVYLELDGFDALTRSAAERIKKIRQEVHEHVKIPA